MKKENYLRQIKVGRRNVHFFSIQQLEEEGVADIGRLPFSIRNTEDAH